MISEPTDEDIAGALRCARTDVFHYDNTAHQIRIRASDDITAASILAHARTLAKLRVAMEVAEERIRVACGDWCTARRHHSDCQSARDRLAAIKETGYDAD